MTENKRFVDNGFEAIEEQSFTDTETDKTYYVDYFDEIIDLCNKLNDENKQLQNTIARLQLINNKLRDKDYTNYKKKIQELQEENERLRRCINEIYTIARLEEV